jgi:tRNA (mo5U34)-methyltransferase
VVFRDLRGLNIIAEEMSVPNHNQELRSRVQQLTWYHSIDLGNGIITPGRGNDKKRAEWLKLPASFKGKSVLDVGAFDGFFSFEAEKRGAKRVLATDSYAWSESHHWASKQSFDLAKTTLNSKVEEMIIDVLELSPERVGMFDVVLFLGVLYHMKYPLMALERVASVTREMIVLETLVDMLHYSQPAVAFYPDDEMFGDATNWHGPNPAAVKAMLHEVGFNRVEIVSGPLPMWTRFMVAAKEKFTTGGPFWNSVRTSRIAVHAWK